jgi:PAS domain S-box-containing protein
VGIAPNVGSSGRASAPEPPARGVDKRLKRYLGFASKLMAHTRERSLAPMRHSLAVRLLTSVLLFSTCVTLILTLLQLYLDYRHDVSALELQLDQISRTNLDSLTERLWALDENQLRLQLTGILRLPDMRAVEVREVGSAGDPLVISLGEKSASTAITREYPLLYNVRGQNTRVGTLYVQATLANIHQRLFHTAWTIFFNQAAETFLVSLFIVYIFHNFVTRHLFAIATFVDSYRINDPPSPLRLRRPPRRHEDELQQVVTAFNVLSDNLQVAYRSLHDINEQLTRDVAARRQAEAVLREREARIRRLIDAGIIGIFLWDIEGPIFEANDAFLRMVGYDREDLVSGRLRWTDLTPPEWRDRETQQWVPELKTTGRLQPFEKEYFRKDGSRVPVLIGSASFEESTNQGVSFVLDLTERKRAEAERERLRQLEADLAHINRVTILGELAASLSHELKQPIAAAITNARTCLRWLMRDEPDVQEARDAATRMVKDGKRAAEIIDRLRSFYKRGAPPERELVDVNEVVREMIGLLRSEANTYSISMRTDLGGELPKVMADRVQLQQVFMNLMLNGIEAMKDTGGELAIKAELGQDGYLLISVSDTGVGLPVETPDEIFSAFFTTKPQGSGMGLAISRSIIEAHGGRLWASANTGRGATFHFTLPNWAMASSTSAG